MHNLQNRVIELNKAAAQNARAEAAPNTVVVAGSMGPTGQIFEPLGTLTFGEAKAAFAEQARGLSEGGVDMFWVETLSDLNEVKAAIEGARSVSDLPIVTTMPFDTHGHTMLGVSPVKTLETLSALNVCAIGANCGTDPDELAAAVKTMREADPAVLLVAKANAGIPQVVESGEILYNGTPEVMARYVRCVRDLGVSMIGACCGSTPRHIHAMAEALGRPVPR